MVLFLSSSDVDNVVSTFTSDDLTNLMAQVFFSLSSSTSPNSNSDPSSNHPRDSKVSKGEPKEVDSICLPHRLSVPTTNHTALFMPSRMMPFGTAMKVVSVPSASAPDEIKQKGLPASTIVLDEITGEVKALVNASKLTALRNAAGSLLSTRLLLSSRSSISIKNFVAIGAGAQIEAHISLFLNAYPSITSCKIFNRSINLRLSSLISSLLSKFPKVSIEGFKLPQQTAKSISEESLVFEEAIRDADIIVTATSSKEPLFPASFVSSGTHLCLIGSYTPDMQEVDTDLIRRAGVVVVDSKEACQKEAGEIIRAELPTESLAELGSLFDLLQTNRTDTSTFESLGAPCWIPRDEIIAKITNAGDISIFKSVGVGVQDVAIAVAVVRKAEKERIGAVLEF